MAESMISHVVCFKLEESSPAAIDRQLAACRKYLTGHEGVLFFAVGTRTADLLREVNDRDFDVQLNVVFKNRAAHDHYQVHPRHLQFIEENKPHWAKVRVFDADAS